MRRFIVLVALAPACAQLEGFSGGDDAGTSADGGEGGATGDASGDGSAANDGGSDATASTHALYVLGGGPGNWGVGLDGGEPPSIPDVVSATINPDGSLGAWTKRTDLLAAHVHGNPAVVTGDRFGVIVGNYGTPTSGADGTVQFAALTPSGDLTWTQTTAFSPPRGGWSSNYSAASDGNTIFLVGGDSTGKSVQKSTAVGTGGVGPWSSVPDLPNKVDNPVVVLLGTRLYVVGNVTLDGGYTLRIVYGEITGGSIASWTLSGAAGAPTPFHGAAAFGSTIYAVGGRSTDTNGAITNVSYANVDGNGAPGAWQPGAPLPDARSNSCVVAGPNAIYVIGGELGFGNTGAYDTVYYTLPAADGAIGSWKTATPLPTARSGVACVIL